jgi:proline iminopeptidase
MSYSVIRKIGKGLLGLVAVSLVVVVALAFWPIQPTVAPIEPRPSTRYWAMRGGYRIAFTHVPAASGVPARPPIVYLHGGPGGYVHSSTIAEVGKLARLGHDIYFYDQSGTGLSDRRGRPKDTTFDGHVADLAEIVETHVAAPRVIVMGHSFGGVLATHYAARHPERMAGLILSAPGDLKPNLFDEDGRWVNEARYPAPAELAFIDTSATLDHDTGMGRLPVRAIISLVLAQLLDVKLAPDREVDAALNTMASRFTRSMVCEPSRVQPEEGGGGAYSRIGVNFFPDDFYDPRQDMATMTAPVLVLHGQCDIIPYAAVYEYVDLFPDATYRFLEGAGHEMWWDRPDDYVDAIAAFLTEHFDPARPTSRAADASPARAGQ